MLTSFTRDYAVTPQKMLKEGGTQVDNSTLQTSQEGTGLSGDCPICSLLTPKNAKQENLLLCHISGITTPKAIS